MNLMLYLGLNTQVYLVPIILPWAVVNNVCFRFPAGRIFFMTRADHWKYYANFFLMPINTIYLNKTYKKIA